MKFLISKLCPCFGKELKDDADTSEIPTNKKYTFSQGVDNSSIEEPKSDLTLGVPFERANIKQESLMLSLRPERPCVLYTEKDRRDTRFNTPAFNPIELSTHKVAYSAPCETQNFYAKAKV